MFTIILLAVLSAEPVIVESPTPTRRWSNDDLTAGCIDDNAAACARLARRYLTGRGAKQDLPRAAMLFDTACEMDDAGACVQLGAMVYNGNGVPVDHVRAVSAFEHACELGAPSACASLGQMFARGLGMLVRDKVKARELFVMACDSGWTRACRMGR